MNYYYAKACQKEDETAANIVAKEKTAQDGTFLSGLFGERELVTIRLRDFSKKMREEAAEENECEGKKIVCK